MAANLNTRIRETWSKVNARLIAERPELTLLILKVRSYDPHIVDAEGWPVPGGVSETSLLDAIANALHEMTGSDRELWSWLCSNPFTIYSEGKIVHKPWPQSADEDVPILPDEETKEAVEAEPVEAEPVEAEPVDMINAPPHYAGRGVEPMDLIEAYNLNFACGNVVKYTCRAGEKDGEPTLKDLHKARWYLNREIARLEKLE